MSLRIIVAPEARSDLFRLNAFLAEKSEGAARRAMDAVEAAWPVLGDWPLQGLETGSGLRELKISFGDTGYVVRYRVDPEHIVIARVFHMREDR
jgi:plasmid stabilization system protein ParE